MYSLNSPSSPCDSLVLRAFAFILARGLVHAAIPALAAIIHAVLGWR